MAYKNLEKQRETQRAWGIKHKRRLMVQHRTQRQKVKAEILTHYGNGRLACGKCGFEDVRALTIDHLDGGGQRQLQKLGLKAGITFYYWLRTQGYPMGYQTLCANCQFIKRVERKEWGSGHKLEF